MPSKTSRDHHVRKFQPLKPGEVRGREWIPFTRLLCGADVWRRIQSYRAIPSKNV